MRIAEVYASIQGEGFLTGTPSLFIRTSGCNLRCVYCDTPFASWQPEGDSWSVPQLLETVEGHPHTHVVITGGEPMLFPDLVPLTHELHARGRHVTIETAGTLFLPVHCELMSISPKLSNSTPKDLDPAWRIRHEQTRHAPQVIRSLIQRFPYQFKFVCQKPADAEEALEYLDQFPDLCRDRLMLMPQGMTAAELNRVSQWLRPFCQDNQLQFCPRRHIEWFGSVRGT